MRKALVILAIPILCLAAVEPVDPTVFGDRDGVAQGIHDRPTTAVTLLEGILSQDQADDFQSQLLTTATDDDKRAELAQTRVRLLRIGLAPGSPLVYALDAEIGALAVALEPAEP